MYTQIKKINKKDPRSSSIFTTKSKYISREQAEKPIMSFDKVEKGSLLFLFIKEEDCIIEEQCVFDICPKCNTEFWREPVVPVPWLCSECFEKEKES